MPTSPCRWTKFTINRQYSEPVFLCGSEQKMHVYMLLKLNKSIKLHVVSCNNFVCVCVCVQFGDPFCNISEAFTCNFQLQHCDVYVMCIIILYFNVHSKGRAELKVSENSLLRLFTLYLLTYLLITYILTYLYTYLITYLLTHSMEQSPS